MNSTQVLVAKSSHKNSVEFMIELTESCPKALLADSSLYVADQVPLTQVVLDFKRAFGCMCRVVKVSQEKGYALLTMPEGWEKVLKNGNCELEHA